ncbi:MAG: DNA polymerase III subunit beta [Candidatus Cryosericum sp.]|nr:DNA polymerase III subunit beta [bacterium]
MKFTAKAEGLSRKLTQHAKVIQQKSSTFTSDAVLLVADGTVLKFTSTDLTTYLTNAEPAEVSEAGRALVPFKFLRDIISVLSGELTIEGDEKKLQISSGKAHYDLSCYQMDTFPSVPDIREGREYDFSLSEYTSAIDRVLPCVERNEKRRLEFQGILVEQTKEYFRFVATDSRRLGYVQFDFKREPLRSIVPTKVFESFKPTADVHIVVTEDECKFVSGDTEIVSMLIGAEFPNYNDIIPREWEYTVTIKKSELLDALRRVGAVVFGGTDVITLSFKEGRLTVQGTAQDQGDARDELGYEGDAGGLSVSFFGTKLLDGISAVATENAEMHMNSAIHPVVIKDQGKEDFLYLVMPHKQME